MTATDPALAQALGRARLSQHHRVGGSAMALAGLMGALLVVLLWGQAPAAHLLGWAVALAVALALRLGVHLAGQRAVRSGGAHDRWLLLTRGAFAVHGLVWAAATLLLAWQLDHQALDLLVFALAAMIAGSLVATAFDLVAASVFSVPALLPVLLRLFSVGEGGNPGLGAVLLLFMFVMVIGARRTQAVVQDSVRLRLAEAERADEAHRLAEAADTARRELADQHQLLTQLLQSTRQGCWFIDNQGLTTDVNPAMCELLGRPREQILGRSAFEFFSDEDLAVMRREVAARKAGQRGGYEVDIVRPDGSRRRGHNNATPIFDARGVQVGSVGLWTDLTTHVQTEASLRIYEAVANAITDSVSVIGEDQVYRMVNDAWARTTGIPREQALGRRAQALLPRAISPERKAALADCLRLRQVQTVCDRIDTHALAGRLMETTYFPYLEGLATVPCAVLVTRDVTEREEARVALADGAEYLRRTLNATSDAIFASDAENPAHRVRFVNAQFMQMWGIPPEMAADLTPREIMAFAEPMFAHRDAELRLIDQTLAANVAAETRLRLRDGRVLLRRFVPSAPGERALRVWSFRDITAELLAQTALIAARDEAERANAAKSRFLSHMSHELRTPMNAILGFAQLLEDDRRTPLADAQRAHVTEILRGGRHLLALINEVLDLGRIEADNFTLTPMSVPLPELADECLSLVRPLALSCGVSLLPPAGFDPGSAVLGDAMRLRQVLLNLLGNAIKYNRRDGVVGLTCARDGGTLLLTVHDTGPGLDEAALARLFRPFERLDAGRTAIEGTGIGLALSRRLVEAMGGQIGVASEPGVGSRFWVRLPSAAAVGPALPSVPARPAVQASADQPSTVLYIEDNPVNAVLMEGMLAQEPDLRLRVALQPSQGLAMARAERPALVMLDIHMPEMDGFEVLARLRADPALHDVPVVAVSANAHQADIDEARAAGFDGYLTKPLDMALLLSTVREVLTP